MTTKKVLVVDDSAFMRTIISDLIIQDHSFEIIGTASNGVDAVHKVMELKPDAVTLDVEMPIQNGLVALQSIMTDCPTPVIMLSSLTEEGRSETLSALEYGAFDFVCKPSPAGGTKDIHKVGEMLREKLHTAIASQERKRQLERLREQGERLKREYAAALPTEELVPRPQHQSGLKSRTNDGNKLRAQSPITSRAAAKLAAKEMQAQRSMEDTPINGRTRAGKSVAPNANEELHTNHEERLDVTHLSALEFVGTANAANSTRFEQIVAIGTSTGGPRALKELLSALPKHIPAPILVVQHMPPNFTKSLAERLNNYSDIEVREAQHGDVLQTGVAYIAPGGMHMMAVRNAEGNYSIALSKGEPRNGHRPSVDSLFESLLPLKGLKRHIVLLTGMGSDGAKMMKRLADEGVTSTFVESEESCVVFGMPRAAIELGCVSQVIPLHQMAKSITHAMK
ncbi:protein-glutamate methylesterase/protein-glutamine glutaminase [Paenibacillus popilliae]|uniref:Protein-glutamate methylesterase/protein-glutamine glutaminase n=1 Tax=Paenibacillus popilliae TaxID=78057 RepID=A0ABY3AYX5_PAEPP|nr:chemotaxis response regulator protein-glutamate methylesterase [Paenibacillus sp. SDF0028]TQR45813.1 chemotaxis response regulator protein-glutamate methylesterase [Paenibacillus sp. SDF0028]